MALDADDLKKIAELMAAERKATLDEMKKEVAPLVEASTKPLRERLDKADKAAADAAKKAAEDEAAKAAAAKAAADEAAKAAAGTRPAEPDPAIATKLKELEAQVRAERDARAAAEAKSKQEALDRTLRDALASAGVPSDRLKHALAVIQADGVIADHNGVPHWKGKVGDVDGLHALDAGIGAWVKGEGKIYLPAAPVKPSGSEGGQRTPTNGAQVDWSKLGGMLRPNSIQ